MKNVYAMIILGHKSFITGKIIIVALPNEYVFIDTYRQLAKEKACQKLGIKEDETVVFDFKFFGEDVVFVD